MTGKTPQVALVTGGARRIGRAIAAGLAAHGWQVAIHYNASAEDAEEAVADIEQAGGRAMALEGDLADTDALAGIVAAAAKAGPLTCLVNNASLFEHDEAQDMTPAGWDAHMAVNLRAPAFLAQHFAAQLPQGSAGNIINLLDQRVRKLNPRFFSYTLSKAALWTATRTMAQAFAPDIRVNAIAPGPTLRNARQSEQDFDRQTKATLLQRGATPEEIAAAVRFILDAPSMTGQMIALDGGQHLVWQTPDIAGLGE